MIYRSIYGLIMKFKAEFIESHHWFYSSEAVSAVRAKLVVTYGDIAPPSAIPDIRDGASSDVDFTFSTTTLNGST